MLKKTMNALSAGAGVFLSLANPVNLLFVALLFMAGFALFNEQILLVGFISTLALLTAALGAGLLAAIFVSINKTLSQRGFSIFLAIAFIVALSIWSFEIFITIPDNPWLYVASLALILLVSAFYLVPRLRDVYRSAGIMV